MIFSILDCIFILFSVVAFLVGCYPDLFCKGYQTAGTTIFLFQALPLILGIAFLILACILELKKRKISYLFPGLAIVPQVLQLAILIFMSFEYPKTRYGYWLSLFFSLVVFTISIPFWIRARKKKQSV